MTYFALICCEGSVLFYLLLGYPIAVFCSFGCNLVVCLFVEGRFGHYYICYDHFQITFLYMLYIKTAQCPNTGVIAKGKC